MTSTPASRVNARPQRKKLDMKPIIFRQGSALSASTKPLWEGDVPTKANTCPGFYHVLAHSLRPDGRYNVSLFDDAGKAISCVLTKSDLNDIYELDGIKPVWVDDDFRYSDIKSLTS